jgi:hypothetical protein
LHSFGIVRGKGAVVFGSFAAAALLLVAPVAFGDDPPPPAPPLFTSGPTIQGDTFVGATLTAVATWTGQPLPVAKYQWRRCSATGGQCDPIADAINMTYVVTAADLGYRLGVRITLKNKLASISAPSVTTAVVVAAPAPTPTPTPTPGPTPPPSSDPTPDPKSDPTPEVRNSFTEPVAPIVDTTAPTLLRPFPIVRIRGYYKRRGVRVTLLSVNAPRSAHIAARCVGRGCPVRSVSLSKAPARLRPFERYLPAGTVLQIRVTSPGRIGKYASFVIRRHSAPRRNDLCLMPGKVKPAACPTR